MTALIVIAGLWLLWAVAVTVLHPTGLYPFSTAAVVLEDAALTRVPGPDGTELHLWERPGEGPTILYFMGNAGSLTLFAGVFDGHGAAGHRVVALQYRGGGGAPGRPSEAALKADALAAFDAVAGDGPVVVRGFSLGAALALHVAAERPVAGVILEAPFARGCELIAARTWVPACVMPAIQRWDSLAVARGGIAAPVLITHGSEDALVPPSQGRRLAAALEAGGAQVAFEEMEGAGHADLPLAPAVPGLIGGFVDRVK